MEELSSSIGRVTGTIMEVLRARGTDHLGNIAFRNALLNLACLSMNALESIKKLMLLKKSGYYLGVKKNRQMFIATTKILQT